MSTYAVASPAAARMFRASHAVVDLPTPGGPYTHRIRMPEPSTDSTTQATDITRAGATAPRRKQQQPPVPTSAHREHGSSLTAADIRLLKL